MCIYVNLRRQRESESLHHLLNTMRWVWKDTSVLLTDINTDCRRLQGPRQCCWYWSGIPFWQRSHTIFSSCLKGNVSSTIALFVLADDVRENRANLQICHLETKWLRPERGSGLWEKARTQSASLLLLIDHVWWLHFLKLITWSHTTWSCWQREWWLNGGLYRDKWVYRSTDLLE